MQLSLNLTDFHPDAYFYPSQIKELLDQLTSKWPLYLELWNRSNIGKFTFFNS